MRTTRHAGWTFEIDRGKEGDAFKLDELRLMVFPVLLGEGKRLFGDVSEKKPLQRVGSRELGDGIALLTYEPTT